MCQCRSHALLFCFSLVRVAADRMWRRRGYPIQGEWKLVEVNGATDPQLFMNTVWKFKSPRHL